MEFFYSNHIEGDPILLDEEESRHCIKVMRHRSGDELLVTDGKGKLVRAKLIHDDARKCSLEILETIKETSRFSNGIHIAIAPTKNIDRFEWFLEKATEIGITEITPVICRRSERNKIKQERMEKILLSAMKQSLRLWLPKLNSLTSLKDFIAINSGPSVSTLKFICHCQVQNLPLLKSLYRSKNDVLVLIGPEGDFTLEEISLAEANGFSAVNLSDARLRTETAGIVAVHTIHFLNT